jgi:hypothetical protein
MLDKLPIISAPISSPSALRGYASVVMLCALCSACSKQPEAVLPIADQRGAAAADDMSTDQEPASRKTVARRRRSAPEPDAAASVTRANTIRRDLEAVRAECQRAAAGDWDRWQRETERYRADLRSQVNALELIDPPRSLWPEGKFEPLEGRDGFPLFEVGAREHLQYLYDPSSLDAFRKGQSVLTIHRWLRSRNIDLIFVPVPKMTEIYIEHFLDPCPSDGIIAPHFRRTLLELFENGVEVVDGFTLFRSLKDSDTEFLGNTCDTHWSPRAMRIMAKELADRVIRYKFGAKARYGMPIVNAEPRPYLLDGFAGGIGSESGWMSLSKEQQQRAARAQTMTVPYITSLNHRDPADDPDSPVVLIGHSYLKYFREMLIQEINQLVRTCPGKAGSLGLFNDLLREPELLEGCRVLIWITTPEHMMTFKSVAPPIAAAADKASQ